MINLIPVFTLMQEYCHFIAVLDFSQQNSWCYNTHTHIHTCGDVIVVERVFISLKAFFSVCVFSVVVGRKTLSFSLSLFLLCSIYLYIVKNFLFSKFDILSMSV